MNTCRLAFILLLLTASALHAQYIRVDAAIGRNGSDGTLHLYLFDPRRTQLKIIDQGGFADQPFKNLGEAMQKYKCVAGCTGAASNPDGTPIGLVIADGKQSGARNISDAAAAGVVYIDGAQLRMARAKTYFQGNPSNTRHLLQTGPFLVEGGKEVAGLPDRGIARRSFILTDGGNRWAIGYAPATTLSQLAEALAKPATFQDFKVATALSFDKGSSSGIWIDRKHAPLYLKEIRKVRNFVGLVRR